jgi:hypothetical protein
VRQVFSPEATQEQRGLRRQEIFRTQVATAPATTYFLTCNCLVVSRDLWGAGGLGGPLVWYKQAINTIGSIERN